MDRLEVDSLYEGDALMTNEYVHQTYGTPKVWNEALQEWREPRTDEERKLAEQISRDLKNSLKEHP